MKRIKGIGASDGIALGRARVLDRRTVKTPKFHLEDGCVDAEVARFLDALTRTDAQLQKIKEKLVGLAGDEHALILQAHQLILKDEHLVEKTVRRIRDQRVNAEWALSRTVREIKRIFDRVEDDYFRERRSDVGFVADHVLHTLIGDRPAEDGLPFDAVVVAHDISPAQAAELFRRRVRAFVTERGGTTSHTAIIARSLGIPMVVAVRNAVSEVGNGDHAVVDGNRGQVILQPTAEVVARYQRRLERRAARVEVLRRARSLPAVTTDGVRVRLVANAELVEEVPLALDQGAEGVGLYRTEILFLEREEPPTEEEHRVSAERVLAACPGRPVTFRTLDLGGDKVPGFFLHTTQKNPALGLCSLRLCLEQKALFRAQLRGLLRAAPAGDMRIMFPMVSGVEELHQARAVLDQCRAELAAEGVRLPPVPVGIMVELPSAAVIADLLAQDADFFAIGTNDLTQYALAIDRENQHVGRLFRPFHPAILRLIRGVVAAADEAGIPVSVCGEMAGDTLMTLLLMGLGVRALSMRGPALPLVKHVVRNSSLADARALADAVMTLRTCEDVEGTLLTAMEDLFPDQTIASSAWDTESVSLEPER